MSSFLLVHGAWVGGWYWRDVAAILRADGHDVFTPTLTGMGERSHLAAPEVNLETHIADIQGVIEYERLDDFALIAHSYGGMVATAVADAMPERIRSLIYIDAALPQDGQAMLDLVPEERKAMNIRLAEEQGQGFQVPGSMILKTGITDEAAREAFMRRVCFHPLAALLQPIKLTGAFARIQNKAYIYAAKNAAPRFENYMEWAKSEPGWDGAEIDTHHYPMSTMPDETAELFSRFHHQ